MRTFMICGTVVILVTIWAHQAEAQSCSDLEAIANSEDLAQMQMDLRSAAVNLDRLADAVNSRVDSEIASAISAIEGSSRTLSGMSNAVSHLLAPSGVGSLVSGAIAVLERTVGAHGGITGVQADTWRLHETSALTSGASDAREAAEAIFQLQVDAGRQYSNQCN